MVNSWAIYGHSCKSDQIEHIKNTVVSHLLMLNNEHEYTESHESQGQLFGSFGQLPPFGQWVFDKSRVRFC